MDNQELIAFKIRINNYFYETYDAFRKKQHFFGFPKFEILTGLEGNESVRVVISVYFIGKIHKIAEEYSCIEIASAIDKETLFKCSFYTMLKKMNEAINQGLSEA